MRLPKIGDTINISFLKSQRQSISDGKHTQPNPRVFINFLIEFSNGPGITVSGRGRFPYGASPGSPVRAWKRNAYNYINLPSRTAFC